MHVLLGLMLLTTCVASTQDMSDKMFTFPLETKRAHVRLNTTKQDFGAVTVCHRSFTDLRRDHSLFSLATPTSVNDLLIFWDATNKEMEPHIRNKNAEFRGQDYKLNTWHSICTTWDSESGLVQMWFDGQPSIRKFVASGANIRGPVIIILGQEQDAHGGGFDQKQSFVGMMSDVHMWDYTLSRCEIQNYVDQRSFTPGNVLNWRALDFQITDKVLIENKETVCY
ncbi:C-reactive protein [Austrofundulus limnaeus]|uniref:Pentraxin family member n=1 Tax=Austrofundulus limnaeus TaxID=52670 RepID=A0A2I4CBE2_AUSLI|nr:PREDICTED: C-reactive protein-like [Austrofundulus limnaeus]